MNDDVFGPGRHQVIPTKIAPTLVESTIDAFFKFLALPDTVRNTVNFPSENLPKNNAGNTTRDGFTMKPNTNEPNPDRKAYFHHRRWMDTSEECKRLKREYAEVRELLSLMSQVHFKAGATLYRFVEQKLPELADMIFEIKGGVPHPRRSVLRILTYLTSSDQEHCAIGHYDVGGMTLAVAESDPGLRIGCCEAHGLEVVKHQPYSAICFPGLMLHEVTDEAILPAWHDVIHIPGKQKVNERCVRWALVLFVEIPGMAYAPWERSHTPMH